MKWTISLYLVFFSCSVLADPTPWMKQTKPNNLGLFVGVSDSCPFTQKGLLNRIEGEFLRARLKPSKSTTFNLTVSVQCMSVKNRGGTLLGNAVNYEIRYGSKMPNGGYVLYESPNYGSMLVGGNDSESTQYLINTITDGASLALTDYLKANF